MSNKSISWSDLIFCVISVILDLDLLRSDLGHLCWCIPVELRSLKVPQWQPIIKWGRYKNNIMVAHQMDLRRMIGKWCFYFFSGVTWLVSWQLNITFVNNVAFHTVPVTMVPNWECTNRTVCYPEEKNQTSIFILLHISNHWFLRTLCIKMESSYFTIKGPSHLTKHSYSYLSVSIFHCFINKNSEFCGHISSGLHLPGFTWPVIFFSGFYDWNWLKNGSLSPASECLLFYSSGYITHEITVQSLLDLLALPQVKKKGATIHFYPQWILIAD